jgi:hypothetical protein
MPIDIYVKSSELLNSLANSIYDRDKPNIAAHDPIIFTITEVQIVERWLRGVLSEYGKDQQG